jgi:hypothetical protein
LEAECELATRIAPVAVEYKRTVGESVMLDAPGVMSVGWKSDAP